MRSLRLYLLTLCVFLIAFNAYALRAYDLSYPHPLGPQLDNDVRQNHVKAITENQPQLVLIGDSTLTKGVDPIRLARALDTSTYSIGLPGSASTLWYLIIKNNVIEAPVPPKYLVIFFRDSMLTMPGYRVQGQYFEQIDEYASPKDELLIERAFIGLMNPAEQFAERYVPIYTARREMRADLDTRLHSLPAGFIACDAACLDAALSQPFGAENLAALNQAITEADTDLYAAENLNFKKRVDVSFLPELARLSNENGIQLILVRMKTLQFTRSFPALDNYMKDLKEYARANHALVLDFYDDPRLPAELYMDILHLNDAGKLVFTDILADVLNPILH